VVEAAVPLVNEWTWMGGSTSTNVAATYGSPGTANPLNTPGARYGGATWTDNAGHLWLFGGTSNGGSSWLNDLWMYDGASWTWERGSSTTNVMGTYGAPGDGGATATPGSRLYPSYARDLAGNFWLFGGQGYGSTASSGMLSDVWKFDGASWTWVAGASTVNVAPTYGTPDASSPSNTPGGRQRAATWVDASSHLWIFGGYDGSGDRNDLWMFDGASWTWVSGASTTNAPGVYQGVPLGGTVPGARQDSVTWIDAAGHLWLYGGYGYDSAGAQGDLGDLWKFDGATWTWVNGSQVVGTAATYGTMGVAATTNSPGSRENAVSWPDAHGNLWLFSGTSGHNSPELNDLWKFDGASWTWMKGASTTDPVGTYGSVGEAGPASTPGGRDSAVGWVDASGNLWVYGGWGIGASGSASDINDLWRYQP
jgi:N-acetylneuraminic acid mutarotase